MTFLLDLGACGRADTPVAADDCAASAEGCQASPPAPETATATASPPEACDWDPVFGLKHCQQNGWWLEFSVDDSSATALAVELSGTPTRLVALPQRIDFADGVAKFGGVVDAEVRPGTLIRLKATQSVSRGGATASSAWFGYREEAPTLSCRMCAPSCPVGSCFAGRCVCTPSCPPNSCGSDGCGGSCGSCSGGATCDGKRCVCTPQCSPDSCGPDGCGGPCTCAAGAVCTEGQCITCTPTCGTNTCGSDGCGGSCGSCAAGTSCVAGQCLGCTPSCRTNTCGSDGCGGSCGACAAGANCDGGQCVACVPSCAPGSCGGDGCGGSCGVCAAGSTCDGGQCAACVPSCAPSRCGADGCGGSCGPCASGASCVAGQCVACVPSCAPGSCGADGCGGLCGACSGGSSCVAGQCVAGCVAAWNPRWRQGDSAGAWWAEFEVAGGGTVARTVSLELVGGSTAPLTYGWERWSGRLNDVAAGSLVILHATDALGATAQTVPFRYLVDPAPLTDPCLGTPRTSTTCQPLARGMVTFTIDDSSQSQADVAVPLLRKYGLKATFYQVPPWLTWVPLARTLALEGHETGAHTMTHRSLTALTPQEVDDELRLSRQWLETNVSAPVESFACPSGAYNAAVIAAIKPYFGSHRTTVPGMNSVGSDVYELSTHFVMNTSTVAGVCAQVAEAAALKSWLILTFHDFTTAASSTMGFTCPASVFEGILACAKNTPGLDVVTTRQGVAAIGCGSP